MPKGCSKCGTQNAVVAKFLSRLRRCLDAPTVLPDTAAAEVKCPACGTLNAGRCALLRHCGARSVRDTTVPGAFNPAPGPIAVAPSAPSVFPKTPPRPASARAAPRARRPPPYAPLYHRRRPNPWAVDRPGRRRRCAGAIAAPGGSRVRTAAWPAWTSPPPSAPVAAPIPLPVTPAPVPVVDPAPLPAIIAPAPAPTTTLAVEAYRRDTTSRSSAASGPPCSPRTRPARGSPR